MNLSATIAQLGMALFLFIRSLFMIFAPEKVISSKRFSQIKKENRKKYTMEHAVILMELSFLFIIMLVIEPYFSPSAIAIYLGIYFLALIILFFKLYTVDIRYLEK